MLQYYLNTSEFNGLFSFDMCNWIFAYSTCIQSKWSEQCRTCLSSNIILWATFTASLVSELIRDSKVYGVLSSWESNNHVFLRNHCIINASMNIIRLDPAITPPTQPTPLYTIFAATVNRWLVVCRDNKEALRTRRRFCAVHLNKQMLKNRTQSSTCIIIPRVFSLKKKSMFSCSYNLLCLT